MKKYHRKINYQFDDSQTEIVICPEKLPLKSLADYVNQDNLNYTEIQLQKIQDLTYKLCEIIYRHWSQNRKQQKRIQEQLKNQNNEEGNYLCTS